MTLSWKLELNGVDVTSFIVGTPVVKTNSDGSIPQINFRLDESIPVDYDYGTEVAWYIKVDSYFKEFSGFIIEKEDEEESFSIKFRAKGHAFKAKKAEYTGRFREDAGNGNMKDILHAIIDEKFPDWTYDDTSIPDIDIDYLSQLFQDRQVSSIFDTYALRANRVWFVDQNKKFWLVERDFALITSTISQGVNTVGRFRRKMDDSRFANIVKVLGARFPVTTEDKFVCGGTAQEFELSNFPNGATNVKYSSGTELTVALEGVQNYDVGTSYDAYFKPDIRKLTFNVNTVVGETLTILYNGFSKVYEDLSDAASISLYNLEKVKHIDDDAIVSVEDAYIYCRNYLDNHNLVSNIYTVKVIPTTQQQVIDWNPGNKVPLVSDKFTGDVDILEKSTRLSPEGFLVITLTLNHTPEPLADKLADFLKLRSERDDFEKISTDGIIKTFYFGGNIVVDFENISYDGHDTDDTFQMQDPHVPPDYRSLMGGTAIMRDEYTGTALATKEIKYSYNSRNKFRERWTDSFFVDENNSFGTLDLDNNYYTLAPGGTLTSRPFVKGDRTYLTAIPYVEASGTSFSIELANENSGFAGGTNEELFNFVTSGDELKYRLVNTGVSNINITFVRVEYN